MKTSKQASKQTNKRERERERRLTKLHANSINLREQYPRSMRLPDPFKPNLRVESIPEIKAPPVVMSDYTKPVQSRCPPFFASVDKDATTATTAAAAKEGKGAGIEAVANAEQQWTRQPQASSLAEQIKLWCVLRYVYLVLFCVFLFVKVVTPLTVTLAHTNNNTRPRTHAQLRLFQRSPCAKPPARQRPHWRRQGED